MNTQTSHPDLQNKASYRRVIQLQIQRYKRALKDDIPYEAYLRSV